MPQDPGMLFGTVFRVNSRTSAFSIKRTLDLIVLNVCFPAKADSEVGVVTIIKQRLVKTSLKIN